MLLIFSVCIVFFCFFLVFKFSVVLMIGSTWVLSLMATIILSRQVDPGLSHFRMYCRWFSFFVVMVARTSSWVWNGSLCLDSGAMAMLHAHMEE